MNFVKKYFLNLSDNFWICLKNDEYKLGNRIKKRKFGNIQLLTILIPLALDCLLVEIEFADVIFVADLF